MSGHIVAIDGPVGSGKSTVARLVAQHLGCRHVDSGAVYRAVAWLVDREKPQLQQVAARAAVSEKDATAAALVAARAQISFVPAAEEGTKTQEVPAGLLDHGDLHVQDSLRVLVNKQDVTDEIRSLEIAQLTSRISVIPKVRDAVNIKLRELAAGGDVVMDGRDIGTVVLPDADLKVFLTAEVETRAGRRQKELEAAGKKIALEELVQQIQERDHRDSSRAVAPLRPADDAIVIDTNNLSIDEVVSRVVELYGSRTKP